MCLTSKLMVCIPVSQSVDQLGGKTANAELSASPLLLYGHWLGLPGASPVTTPKLVDKRPSGPYLLGPCHNYSSHLDLDCI